MKVYNTQNIIPAGTRMNANLTSSTYQLTNMYGAAIQVAFSGTPTGTFKLQVSCDPPAQSPSEPIGTPTHWTDLVNSAYAVNASGDYLWNVYDCMYNYIRLVYVDTSGGTSTATITNATINAKGV
jgi:hypothetical protein